MFDLPAGRGRDSRSLHGNNYTVIYTITHWQTSDGVFGSGTYVVDPVVSVEFPL